MLLSVVLGKNVELPPLTHYTLRFNQDQCLVMYGLSYCIFAYSYYR